MWSFSTPVASDAQQHSLSASPQCSSRGSSPQQLMEVQASLHSSCCETVKLAQQLRRLMQQLGDPAEQYQLVLSPCASFPRSDVLTTNILVVYCFVSVHGMMICDPCCCHATADLWDEADLVWPACLPAGLGFPQSFSLAACQHSPDDMILRKRLLCVRPLFCWAFVVHVRAVLLDLPGSQAGMESMYWLSRE